MRLRALGLVSSALTVVPVAASAQVAIEHQDVACIVAGQFPVLDACFRPGADLARARVYFRPEGAPSWYYVEASTPTPPRASDPAELLCRRATLPKPKKSLLEKHVEYYLEATGKRLESSQTETYRPLVVKNEEECKKKVVAPFVPNAVVQVFPAMPAAFAAGGGLSGAAVAAVVGAGVAGATGVVVAATNGGGPAPTTLAPVTTTQPPITVPPTTATTTLPPAAAFNPTFKVFNGGMLEAGSTVSGTEPLKLRFFMCESTGPLPLKYNVLVNGGVVTAGCDSTITFSSGGFTTGLGVVVASRGGVRASGTAYSVLMQIQSDGPGNNPKDSRALIVDVTPCSSTPTVALTSPKGAQRFATPPTFTIDFRSNASDPGGIDHVDYFLDFLPEKPGYLAGSSSSGPGYAASVTSDKLKADGVFLSCGRTVQVYAVAYNLCGISATSSPKVDIFIADNSLGCLTFASESLRERKPAWMSDLNVPGGRGQVVLNGSDASFPAAGGRVPLAGHPRIGENRVEATLVQATGQPGLWRFELGSERSLASGSLRVIAGEVTLVTPDSVVFRMKGRPSERVVFTFQVR